MNQATVAAKPHNGIAGAYISPVHPLPEGNFAHIHVRDNLNAPDFHIGDVLIVDLGTTRFKWDGLYVIEINGRQVVRRVQDRGQTFYVFCTSAPNMGFHVACSELVVLASVQTGWTHRRFS